jgi:hypothetical protein
MSYLSRERGDFCGFSGLGEITRSKARSRGYGGYGDSLLNCIVSDAFAFRTRAEHAITAILEAAPVTAR